MRNDFKIKDINKYKLTLKNIKKLGVNRDLVKAPDFWYNNVVHAWCISGSAGIDEYPICDNDEYWLGIYDEPKKDGSVKIECYFTSYGGMCGYEFDKFFDPAEIENDTDYKIQLMFIEKMNKLIEKGVFILPEKNK